MDFSKRQERYASTCKENEELLSWLRLEDPEPVLEPELPIVDPHHHLWDRRNGWWPYKQRVYELREMMEDLADGHNVVGTVYVQAGSFHWASGPDEFRPVGEVEYCQGIAAAADSGLYSAGDGLCPRVCWGIQGTCDLRHPNAEAVLEEMRRTRNFRGVRAAGPYDEDFKRGLRVLQRHGLVFDRWHHPPGSGFEVQPLRDLTALAREFPDVAIVLNHLGGAVGPHLSEEIVGEWRAAITELATCPNVVCKVGGIQMAINQWGFEKREKPIGSEELMELTFPWYEHVIRAFGPSRCMFESNFPVDKESVSYRTLWNCFKRIAAKLGLSDAEKRDIFHDTALRTYKLKPVGPSHL